eukprot:scaffold319811_cov23-Tisochrysis_lutea.AAC.1
MAAYTVVSFECECEVTPCWWSVGGRRWRQSRPTSCLRRDLTLACREWVCRGSVALARGAVGVGVGGVWLCRLSGRRSGVRAV